MPNFHFKPDQPELTTLLEEVHSGALQLPDFQRGWVWDDDRIRGLLASVSLGWPVGAILLLECGGEVRFQAREFEGAPKNPHRERRLALDGQQRLTSLYLALRSGQPVATVNSKQQEIERLYYFDIRRCLDPALDREEAILSIPADRRLRSNFNRDVVLDLSTREHELAAFCVPASVVLSSAESRSWRRSFNELHQHTREVSELWDRFEDQVITNIQAYRVPAIELSRETSREAVCMVFEKVNTGGKPLDVFELVTASFAVDTFDLRKDWDARAKRLATRPMLRDISSAEFLQAATLVASFKRSRTTGGAVGCRRADVLRLELAAYKESADAVELGLVRSAQLLDRACIYDDAYLPYQSQLIPMAAIAAHLGPAFLEEPARSKIMRWYWSGVFGELYGGATETRLARDMNEVVAWIAGGPEPTTVRDCNFSPMRLTTLKNKNSAAYKGLMAQLLQCGARDFYQGDEIERSRYFDDSVDMHHVFPKAWCVTNKLSRERYDSVLNKTPLTGRSNRRVGSKAPSTYLKAIESGGMAELDLVLRSHLLDPAALRGDDFTAAWRTRARELLDRVEAATGKPVQGRDSAEVIAYFGGDVLPLPEAATGTNAVARLFEKYEILETLPSGGMSEGFKVRGEGGVVLFLKRVPVSGIPADALRRELDIYARLERAQATHVLQVHAFERSDDAVALLTEFADGGALSDHLARHPGGLAPADAKPIALEILAGLSELHSLDIVHRDLKPENVFHTRHGTGPSPGPNGSPATPGTWKLGDFGISKSMVRLQTQGRTFQGHGTPGFAPPEQMEGAEAHPSADIYSFGKILAYLLTGQTDVDQIRWPSWGKIARDCTARGADARPGLDEVETAVGGLVV